MHEFTLGAQKINEKDYKSLRATCFSRNNIFICTNNLMTLNDFSHLFQIRAVQHSPPLSWVNSRDVINLYLNNSAHQTELT